MEIKKEFILTVFKTLLENLNEVYSDQIMQEIFLIETQLQQFNNEKETIENVKALFVKLIVLANVGNFEEYYDTFEYILERVFDDDNSESLFYSAFYKIISVRDVRDKMIDATNVELNYNQKLETNLNELKNLYDHLNKELNSVDSKLLNTTSIEDLEFKRNKLIDKTIKNNQQILNDMIYLIDSLNRKISYFK